MNKLLSLIFVGVLAYFLINGQYGYAVLCSVVVVSAIFIKDVIKLLLLIAVVVVILFLLKSLGM